RTVFIGNLTTVCITDKNAYSELKKLCMGYGKVKAIRFRSIAFSDLLPRKIAFIQGKFHSERQTCNAYVEFIEEEAAKKCLELNGTIFQDKHLRVDLAGNEKGRDMKRSVFVGNLDFAAEEEDLWRHFGACGTVENVRIVRDPTTSIGKGFAYVQFSDRAAVTLALKMHDSELNGRKLRVQR
ncbi:RNA-binding domain-containing protein, partial [Martensiomyces pterosporus]